MISNHEICIEHTAAVSPSGNSVSEICDDILLGQSSFSVPVHFDGKGRKLGLIHALDEDNGRSRISRLVSLLRKSMDFGIPEKTRIFAATSVGAMDLIEKGSHANTLTYLIHEIQTAFSSSDVVLVGAACSSGQTALSIAAEQINAGLCEHALVIGCEIVSELVLSGFDALGASSPDVCRPYDRNRNGMTLGEGAAALLLSRSKRGIGRILTVEENCDACHITAPDKQGNSLKKIVRQVVLNGSPIGGIIGHGTGTLHNDSVEISVLSDVFSEQIPPLFSLKGNFGHTLGATGALQTAIGLELCRRGLFPPQAGLITPMPGAEKSVSSSSVNMKYPRLLSINVGFGGLNSVLSLEAV